MLWSSLGQPWGTQRLQLGEGALWSVSGSGQVHPLVGAQGCAHQTPTLKALQTGPRHLSKSSSV